MRGVIAAIAAAALVGGCDGGQMDEDPPVREITVRSTEQQQLHQISDLNRSIALKRAIRDSGYRCQRVERSGFVGNYENLEMWMASCDDGRDWAVFVGPDGSAQVRDCADVASVGLPACQITSQEAGPGDLPQ